MVVKKHVAALFVTIFGAASLLSAATPSRGITYVRFFEADGSTTYWQTGAETYIHETLPNEWSPSWDSETLKAGAVIIRSGLFWRINRTYLASSYPYNNCYKGSAGSAVWDVSAPLTRGGHEQWIPYSSQTTTDSAINATTYNHAETVNSAGRPDAFVSLRYAAGIQNRTLAGSGTWLSKIRYAYLNYGAPYDPNQDCNQTDDQTSTDPSYPPN
jgi:hypothetical protein